MKIYNLERKNNIYVFYFQVKSMLVFCAISIDTKDVMLVQSKFNVLKSFNKEINETPMFEFLFCEELINAVINSDVESVSFNDKKAKQEFTLLKNEIQTIIK